jgi:hypothetical protein
MIAMVHLPLVMMSIGYKTTKDAPESCLEACPHDLLGTRLKLWPQMSLFKETTILAQSYLKLFKAQCFTQFLDVAKRSRAVTEASQLISDAEFRVAMY